MYYLGVNDGRMSFFGFFFRSAENRLVHFILSDIPGAWTVSERADVAPCKKNSLHLIDNWPARQD